MAHKNGAHWHAATALAMSASHTMGPSASCLRGAPLNGPCHLVYIFDLPNDAYHGVLRAVSWAGDTVAATAAYHIHAVFGKTRTFTWGATH